MTEAKSSDQPIQPSRPSQTELNAMLRAHEDWLADPQRGKRLALKGVDLVGLIFRGNLSDAAFHDCWMQAVTFEKVIFERGQILDCDLSGAKLSDVKFGPEAVQIKKTSFRYLQADSLIMTNVQLFDCGFESTVLTNVTFTNCFLDDCNFRGSSFSDFRFAGGTLQNGTLDGVTIGLRVRLLNLSVLGGSAHELDLGAIEMLKGTRFRSMDFTGARIVSVVLGERGQEVSGFAFCRFISAELGGTDFRGIDLSGANFSGSNLTNAIMSGDLSRVLFRGATLDGTHFSDVNAERCDFEEVTGAFEAFNFSAVRANFTKARLAGAHLDHADLRGAVFLGAEMDQTSLGGANLEGAIWINGELCGAGSRGRCIVLELADGTKSGISFIETPTEIS